MRITLVGAYGYTGKLICDLLSKQNLDFNVAGRNADALQQLISDFPFCKTVLLADIQTEDGIRKILDASDLIINCAGPFTEESVALVQAVAASGKIYLDITGEIGYVRDSKIANEESALASGALIVHGCAFESLVAGLGMRLLANELESITEIRTFYHFSHSRPSPGTKLTMKLARFREALTVANGHWAVSDLQNDRLNCSWADFPELTVAVPYPLPEIAFFQWEYQPKTIAGFLLLDSGAALFVNNSGNNSQNKNEIIDSHRRKKTEGPDENARKNQHCNLLIAAKNNSGKELILHLTGTDMYGVTAQSIRLALIAIQEKPGQFKGVISPEKLFDGKEAAVLSQLGFKTEFVQNFSFGKF